MPLIAFHINFRGLVVTVVLYMKDVKNTHGYQYAVASKSENLSFKS